MLAPPLRGNQLSCQPRDGVFLGLLSISLCPSRQRQSFRRESAGHASQEQKLLDGARLDHAVFALLETEQPAIDQLRPGRRGQARLSLPYHAHQRQMKQMRLDGVEIDEHSAAQGGLAKSLADERPQLGSV